MYHVIFIVSLIQSSPVSLTKVLIPTKLHILVAEESCGSGGLHIISKFVVSTLLSSKRKYTSLKLMFSHKLLHSIFWQNYYFSLPTAWVIMTLTFHLIATLNQKLLWKPDHQSTYLTIILVGCVDILYHLVMESIVFGYVVMMKISCISVELVMKQTW